MNSHTNDDPYCFDKDIYGFPALTKKNIEFIKVLIENDPNYRMSGDPNQNYKLMLKKQFPKTYENVLEVVKLIDRADSTHLASEGIKNVGNRRGREITAIKIANIKNLCKLLDEGNVEVVHTIADAVNAEYRKKGMGSGKYNFSFATKFCAYVSLYALGKDNYCIYDAVVSNVLPYYAHLYLGEKYWRVNRNGAVVSTIPDLFKNGHEYNNYRNLMNRICCAAFNSFGYKPTYQELDELLWYYFKGEDSRRKSALATIADN